MEEPGREPDTPDMPDPERKPGEMTPDGPGMPDGPDGPGKSPGVPGEERH
jgi:hypothetical protein